MFGRWFRRDAHVEEGVKRTRTSFFGRISSLLGRTEITDELWDELEELLISADVGVDITEELLGSLRVRHENGEFRSGEDLKRGLEEELVALLELEDEEMRPLLDEGLTVILVIGVNGVGKTTTIAKLGKHWHDQGRRVLLAAGDTFRAAGAEQLEVWAERLKLPCIGSQPGADPSAIVFDAISAAKARGQDLVIADTAGRLHTKVNLMDELRKIRRVIERHDVPSRSLLVLDATTGQNAIVQAQTFADVAGLDGIIVTKLDGTAKGGMVFSVVADLGAPVRFIGTGEKPDDLAEFDPHAFVGALFDTEADGARG
jgi:fused signal recognition particle receptor